MELEKFKEQAKKHGICDMLQDWDNARSKKQLIDIALSIRGIEYIAHSIAEGWGLDPLYISKEFAPFNDAKYIREADGYTSALYCLPEDIDVTIKTTTALIIAHDGVITIPKNHICELYICKSDVIIQGEGKGVVHLYDSVLNNPDSAPVVVKENIHKHGRVRTSDKI